MEAAEPRLLQTLRAHRSDVTSADFYGAAHLATASSDKLVRLWRWTPSLGFVEAEHSPARGHKYGVNSIRYSPQGTMVASCSTDGTTRVWSARDVSCTHQLLQPSGHGVRSCCFSTDSRHIFTGGDDGSFCVWNLQQKHLVRRVSGHEGAMQALCVCVEGAVLFTSCTLGVVKLYATKDLVDSEDRVSRCELASQDDAHDLGVLTVDAAKKTTDVKHDEGAEAWYACRVASGGQDGRVKLWSAEWRLGMKCGAGGARILHIRTCDGHTSAVTCVRWCDDCTYLASASIDKSVRVWCAESGRCVMVLDAHARYVNTVSFSHHDTLMVTGSNDKCVNVWALKSGVSLDTELEVPCSVLNHFASGDLEGIGPAEGVLVTLDGSRGEAARLWSDRGTHGGAINSVSFSGDCIIATGCSDKLVRLFRWSDLDRRLELERPTLAAHSYPVMAVDFHSSGRAILSASLDGTAILWDVETGCRLYNLSVESAGGLRGELSGGGGGARDARVSPHRTDSLLLVASDDHVAPLWRLGDRSAEPYHVYRGHSDAVLCCAWAPEGSVVVTGSLNGDFRLFRSPSSAALATLANLATCHPDEMRQLHVQDDAHDLGVQSCDFSPSASAVSGEPGALLLGTGGNDSLAKLWLITVDDMDGVAERAQVQLVHRLAGHGGNVLCLRFSQAGDIVATTATDKHARVWCCRNGQCTVAVAHGAGAACCAISQARLLAVGCLDGELALWRLPPPTTGEEGTDRCGAGMRGSLSSWGRSEVASWLVEYVLRAPEIAGSAPEQSDGMLARVNERSIDGARVITATIQQLLEEFGCDAESSLGVLLADELDWLKYSCGAVRAGAGVGERVTLTPPHNYLCPVTHHLMLDPVKCADGFTYERAAILECFLAPGMLISPMTNQPLLNAELSPNYELKRAIRNFVLQERYLV